MARERSFWGWGWADRFPDDAGRRALAAHLASMLGIDRPEPRPAPRIDGIALPPPALAIPPALAPFCTAAANERISHCWGKGYRDLVRGFAGDFSGAPDLVARPRSEEELERVLGWCAQSGVAAIPFGGGTSVVGGVERPPRGGRFAAAVAVDTGALDRVLEVDPVSRSARIQAGATGPALESQLAGHGLTLRHFPQSFEFSTLGGWIATRAGGHFATLYTHIDDLVESVRAVTPAGVWESRRLPGSGAGVSPDRMLIGSEGTLGVITEAWVRVRERPRFRSSRGVRFEDFGCGVAAVRALSQSGLYPANCRLIDAQEARITGAGDGSAALLVLGFESAYCEVSAAMERALECCGDHEGVWDEPAQRETAGSSGGSSVGSWRDAFL